MPTSLPIVLAHGIARFDILNQSLREKSHLPDTDVSDRFEYFKGIKSHLEAHGFTVSHPNQSFAGSVDLRAEQLKKRVNEVLSNTAAERVHIIGHSMGGLDARHMIVDKEMANKVATLTTIGTPHRGSPVADHLEKSGASLLLKILDQVLDIDGLADLRTESCEVFNRRAENDEAKNGVRYQTYSASENLNAVFAPLIPAWIIVRDHEGRNDGLVSVRSQQWTRELIANDGTRNAIAQHDFPFPADHLNEVGWWDPEEAINPFIGGGFLKQSSTFEDGVKAVYLQIAQGLE